MIGHCIVRMVQNEIFLTIPEPPLDRHMPFFTGKCFPSTGKKYSRRYRLKLSILCDLLEIILCTLGPEASGELPVMFSKQNSERENFHCH